MSSQFNVRRVAIASVLFWLVACPPLSAGPVTWNTDTSGNWADASNWSSNPSLPGPADDVTIDRLAASVTVTHSSGTTSINSLACTEALTVSGGSLSLAAASTFSGPLAISGGTVNFNGTTQSTVPGAASFGGGSIAGSGQVSFENLTWYYGNIASTGGVLIPEGRALSIVGSNSFGFSLAGGTPRLINRGTTTLSNGPNIISYAGTTALIVNESTGTIDFQSGGFGSSGGGTGTIENHGLLLHNVSTGSPAIGSGWTLVNDGTVRVASGALTVSGVFNNAGGTTEVTGGTFYLSGGGTSTGTFNVSAGATLELQWRHAHIDGGDLQ